MTTALRSCEPAVATPAIASIRGGMLRAASRTPLSSPTTTGMTAIRTITMSHRAASGISASRRLAHDDRRLGGDPRQRGVDRVERAVDVVDELVQRPQVLGLDGGEHAAQVAEAGGDDDEALAHLVESDSETEHENDRLQHAEDDHEVAAHSVSPAPM